MPASRGPGRGARGGWGHGWIGRRRLRLTGEERAPGTGAGARTELAGRAGSPGRAGQSLRREDGPRGRPVWPGPGRASRSGPSVPAFPPVPDGSLGGRAGTLEPPGGTSALSASPRWPGLAPARAPSAKPPASPQVVTGLPGSSYSTGPVRGADGSETSPRTQRPRGSNWVSKLKSISH